MPRDAQVLVVRGVTPQSPSAVSETVLERLGAPAPLGNLGKGRPTGQGV